MSHPHQAEPLPSPPSARLALAAGTSGLAALIILGLAYALTIEPAPRIRVAWREHVTDEQRVLLERTYLLDRGRDPLPGGSFAYDLLDTSRSNISALIEDTAVADTSDIDRNTHLVPFDVEYGEGWMWIAHRVPGIRYPRVRAWIVTGFAVLTVCGYAVALILKRRLS
jgi:hypothetical protein